MTIEEAKNALDLMSVEEIVNLINDSIDTRIFRHSFINEINDTNAWDDLGEYLGGYAFREVIRFSGKEPHNALYFQYNEDEGAIYYYENRKQLLKDKEDWLIDELINRI